MIVVRLEGGLGNQMFQYAAGRYLALHYNTSLFLDLSAYDERKHAYLTQRDYELKIFELPVSIIDVNQLKLYYLYPRNTIERIIGKFNRLRDRFKVVYESNVFYQNDFLRAGSNCYLIGYWQDEKFFSAIRSLLLREFRFPYEQWPSLENILHEIRQSNSVAIHVRRGDYVSHPVFSNYYNQCDVSYYNEAIQWLKKQMADLQLYFFSDEPDWISQHFKDNERYKIIHFDEPGLDMFLMSQCKHNIIANSSYSWWAAYLNDNPQKRVIAPKQWFKQNDKNPACKGWTLI